MPRHAGHRRPRNVERTKWEHTRPAGSRRVLTVQASFVLPKSDMPVSFARWHVRQPAKASAKGSWVEVTRWALSPAVGNGVWIFRSRGWALVGLDHPGLLPL